MSPASNPLLRTIAAAVLLGVVPLCATAAAEESAAPPTEIMMLYKQEPLMDVLEQVGKATGKRFLFQSSGEYRGVGNQVVNFSRDTPVPIDEVYPIFQSIMSMQGFALISTGEGSAQFIKVVSKERAAAEVSETVSIEELEALKGEDRYVRFVYNFKNIQDGLRVQQQLRTISPGMGDGLMILGVQNVGSITITGFAPTVYSLYQVVKLIDEAVDPGIVAIPLKYATAETLAELLREAVPAAGAEGGPGQVQADARTNSLVVSGSSQFVHDIKDTVATLDIPAGEGGSSAGALELLELLGTADGDRVLAAVAKARAAQDELRALLIELKPRLDELGSQSARARQLLELLPERR